MSSVSAVLQHVSIDWIILAVVLLIIAIDALRSGVARAAAVVLASPATLALAPFLGKTAFVGPIFAQLSTPVLQSAVFGGLYLILIILTYRILNRFDSYGPGILNGTLAAAAATASIIAVWIASGALSNVWHFGASISTIFSLSYTLFWLLGSLLVIAYVRG